MHHNRSSIIDRSKRRFDRRHTEGKSARIWQPRAVTSQKGTLLSDDREAENQLIFRKIFVFHDYF